MTDRDVVFTLPDAIAGERALARLGEAFETTATEPDACRRLHLDTFDWRLDRRDERLLAEERRGGAHATASVALRWDRRDGRPIARARAAQTPAFAEEVADTRLGARLLGVTENRRLLVRAEVEVRALACAVLDERRKTVVRARLEQRALRVGRRRRPLPSRIRLEPVKGYARALRAAVDVVGAALGSPPDEADETAEALAVAGVDPGDDPSRFSVELVRGERADASVKAIHRALLDIVVANEGGTREDLDPEFLHDLRVAVRKTRSVLAQVKGVFPKRVVDRFKREFKWLGSATGPTRDLHVWLEKLHAYEAEFESVSAADLTPLHAQLAERQQHEHRRLVRALSSARYRRLVADWRRFLDEACVERTTLPNARRPVEDLAAERIGAAYRRVVRKGRRIDDATPDAALHRLRIDGKKLRYLIDVFRSLYDDADVMPLIKSLKRLQDNLGDFNDLSVQQSMLVDLARDLGEAPRAVMALGRLTEELADRQQIERRRFAKRFSEFLEQDGFERLVHDAAPPTAATDDPEGGDGEARA